MAYQVAGQVYCIKGNPTPAIVDKVKVITQRQIELRGALKPFKFKALGCKWHYVPKGEQP